ncbi:hypothetical protein [Burkholderia sp. PU8-34]
MYRGFNLDLDGADFSEYVPHGRQIHEKNKTRVKKQLDSFKDRNGDLLASKIIANWFPPVEADVFLSHSHRDAEFVIGLSGWLEKAFGLTSFIDSCIWGYSENLLKMIDNKYCYQPSSKTYSYEKRNRSTSHVYMMLSTALTKMMHNCECIMFVNTPRSISPREHIEGEGETDSPWIYSEIAMTSLIEKRPPEEHRERSMVKSSIAMDSLNESLLVRYDVDLTHLAQLTTNDIRAWYNKNQKTGPKSLDTLYGLK